MKEGVTQKGKMKLLNFVESPEYQVRNFKENEEKSQTQQINKVEFLLLVFG